LSSDPTSSSMDPKNPQSYNRYSYVISDPVNSVDSSGLDPGDPDEICLINGEFDASIDCGDQGDPWGCDTGIGSSFGESPSSPEPGPCPPPAGASSQPPPLPSCTLTVESRTLDYRILKHINVSLHGYIVFYNSADSSLDGIAEGLHNGKLLQAGFPSPGASDNPLADHVDGSISGTYVCYAWAILLSDVAQINDADITYGGAFGPNSSSVLNYFLTSLSYLLKVTDFQPWYTIPTTMKIFGYYTPLFGPQSGPKPKRLHRVF
jgi:hypothetical protein